MSIYLAIQNESQSVVVLGGHFGEERTLSEKYEREKSVVKTKGKDEVEANKGLGS